MENKTQKSRKLRNNLTEAEKKLWYYIRNKNFGYKFRRQHPFGPYFVDFICLERKLIIELDGGQHFNSISDKFRDDFLEKEGYHVLRFWNNEVLENIEGVLLKIKNNIELPSPNPSPQGRGTGKKIWTKNIFSTSATP
jgi:very-short-patch-repair endonuclease